MTLIELLVSLMIAGFAIGSIIGGYILAARKADWSTAAPAAQRLALQRMEQLRAARWDLLSNPPTNQLLQLGGTTNVPIQVLQPAGSSNLVASLRTTVTVLYTNLCLVRVDVIWTNLNGVPFTNTLMTYRAPDS